LFECGFGGVVVVLVGICFGAGVGGDVEDLGVGCEVW